MNMGFPTNALKHKHDMLPTGIGFGGHCGYRGSLGETAGGAIEKEPGTGATLFGRLTGVVDSWAYGSDQAAEGRRTP